MWCEVLLTPCGGSNTAGGGEKRTHRQHPQSRRPGRRALLLVLVMRLGSLSGAGGRMVSLGVSTYGGQPDQRLSAVDYMPGAGGTVAAGLVQRVV